MTKKELSKRSRSLNITLPAFIIFSTLLMSCSNNLDHFGINPSNVEFIEFQNIESKKTVRLSFRKTKEFIAILKSSKKTEIYKAIQHHDITIISFNEPDIKMYAGNNWIGPYVNSFETSHRFIVEKDKWDNFLKGIYE